MITENRRPLQIKVIDVIWGLVCFCCCISGDKWAGSVISVCYYALFGILILAVIKNGLSITGELGTFCGSVFFLGMISAIYNTFSGFSYFNLFVHIRQVLYLILFVYCGYYLAYKNQGNSLIFKTVHYISLIAAWVIIFQGVLQRTGIYLNRITFFSETLFQATDTSRYFRPSGFFSEPSYFAEICLIDIFYCLFKKRNLKVVLIEVIALALSTSSLGIVFAYSLFVIWACTQKITRNRYIDFLIKAIMISVLLAAIILFVGYQGDNAIILRIQKGATIKQRTLRSFEIFGKLDDVHKFFGIGMQNLTRYLNEYSITLVNDGVDTIVNKEFAQSFGYILCTLGIPGAITFVGFLASLFIKCKGKNKYFFILIIELCLTASLITRMIFVLYISVIYQMIFEESEENSIQNE